MKLRFAARFLAVFAALLSIGWVLDAPTHYARVLETCAAFLSPVINGWWLEGGGARGALWYRFGEQKLSLQLDLEALSLGVLPLLSLLGATPRLGAKRLALRAALGVGCLFLLHLLVLLLYPILVAHPTHVTDIVGTFLGLLTFVGAPVILWFALTFDEMRPVWHFPSAPVSSARPGIRR